jgi:hypothetical protein
MMCKASIEMQAAEGEWFLFARARFEAQWVFGRSLSNGSGCIVLKYLVIRFLTRLLDTGSR